jgi:hypothetical protein
MPKKTPQIYELAKAVTLAQKALQAAVAEKFPVGTKITCTLSGRKVLGTVTGHNTCWWHTPGEIMFTNDATGKRRKVDASSLSASVASAETTNAEQ